MKQPDFLIYCDLVLRSQNNPKKSSNELTMLLNQKPKHNLVFIEIFFLGNILRKKISLTPFYSEMNESQTANLFLLALHLTVTSGTRKQL